jgi:hypothetical protein
MWCRNKIADMHTEMTWRVVAIRVKTTGPKWRMVYVIIYCVRAEETESTNKCSSAC